MAIRPEMTALVTRLRSITSAATDDVFNGVTYWTDEQLQDILDAHTLGVQDLPLSEGALYTNGVLDWQKQTYHLARGYDVASDVTILDSLGVVVTGTVNTQSKAVSLTAGSQGTQYYVRATVYDMYEAAAEVWSLKASQRSDYVRWKAGNYQANAAEEYQHCLERSSYYRAKRVRRFAR